MGFLSQVMTRFGLGNAAAERHPISVFLLDDDTRRHEWFAKRFAGDHLDIAEDVVTARAMLEKNSYDAIFLDHDLLPEHYNSDTTDDERTGYAIAAWLSAQTERHRAATLVVHTRYAVGAHAHDRRTTPHRTQRRIRAFPSARAKNQKLLATLGSVYISQRNQTSALTKLKNPK